MRFWFDTEFIDAPPLLSLISIGIVANDGREYYAEARDVDWSYASPWVMENVFPKLGPVADRKCLGVIAQEIREFVGNDVFPEFWGYFPAYDWVLLCQLYGPMVDLPKHWPHRPYDILDLKSYRMLDGPLLEKPANAHNALDDARWTRDAHRDLLARQEAAHGSV